MSISLRVEPCWVLRADRLIHDDTGDPMLHYPDRQAALEALVHGTGVDHRRGESLVPWLQQLPAPCMAVCCDDCGASGSTFHWKRIRTVRKILASRVPSLTGHLTI